MTKLKINEMFIGIQGEGRYSGYPALFIRLSGCNLKCEWCDTKYHEKVNFELIPDIVAKRIMGNQVDRIVWTGGEPMLQMNAIREVMDSLSLMNDVFEHHFETNGTFLPIAFFSDKRVKYIAFSPKTKEIMDSLILFLPMLKTAYDIKVVTDGEHLGMSMIKNATILMPLSTKAEYFNDIVRKRVWNLALLHRKRLSLRLHYIVWGNEKGK